MSLLSKPKETDGQESRGKRSILPYVLVFLVVQVLLYALVLDTVRPDRNGREMSLDRFYQLVQQGEIDSATILDFDSRVIGEYQGEPFLVALPRGELAVNEISGTLTSAGIRTQVDQQVYKGILNFLAQFLMPVLLFFTLFGLLFLVFLSSSGLGGLSLFGRSSARRYKREDQRVTFDDVAGIDETVKELEEVKDFLQQPDRFLELGARVPKGVMLMGPPGCGKTLLARAVAGEANVPFYSVSASEFVEMLVGVGASRVRDLFKVARENAPSIIFIDELDAVGRSRNAGVIGGAEERDQTLNELLVQMDGFAAGARVVVITATNRPEILDDALTRPGRFDRHIVVDLPDVAGREAILAVHTKTKPLAGDLDLRTIARRTPGFSGADLANVVNEAAIRAARSGAKVIGRAEFDEGIDRVVTGPENRSRVLTPPEKRRVAFHEAGHALVAWALPGADPIEKVSVISRGKSLGHTQTTPIDERFLMTRTQMENRLTILLAGRQAEIEVFGEPSSTASSDLRLATELARQMVMDLGMGESVAPLTYRPRPNMDTGAAPEYSDRVADELDRALSHLVAGAEARAGAILRSQLTWLTRLADALEERETLQGDEVDVVLEGMVKGIPDRETVQLTSPGLG